MRAVALLEFDYDAITERVLYAADLWLAQDMESDEVLVEHKFDNEIKAVLDLVLIKGREARVVDWKTTEDVKKSTADTEFFINNTLNPFSFFANTAFNR